MIDQRPMARSECRASLLLRPLGVAAARGFPRLTRRSTGPPLSTLRSDPLTSKIRPNNAFLLELVSASLFCIRRKYWYMRPAIVRATKENILDGYVGPDRTGQTADFRAAHAARCGANKAEQTAH